MMKLKILLTACLLWGIQTWAEPVRLDLDLGEQEYSSRSGRDTVYLRDLLERRYGDRYDLRNAELDRIAIFAKSEFGRGEIQLLVGRDLSAPEMIDGDSDNYDRPGVGFARYLIDSPSHDNRGAWQLKIRGNVRISRVIALVNQFGGSIPPPSDPYPPYERIRIGSIKGGNPLGGWDRDTVANPQGGRFRAMEFRLSRGAGLEIGSVDVICRDGRVCYSARVDRELDEYRPLLMNFRYDLPVREIVIRHRTNGISIPPPRADVYLLY